LFKENAVIYHVRAKFREETAADFLAKLSDSTIRDQIPDGSEMFASMDRAVVSSRGLVEWSEMCFCSPPLSHERETVLDRHFDEITTEPIESVVLFDGRSFMEYLRALN
jgi:hypothetical protein